MSSGAGSMSSGKGVRIYTPHPPYSEEARRNHITGSGIAEMTVDTATGAVTNVVMTHSTGNAMLDNSATSTFRRWRFRAGTVARVRQRITFSLMTGSY
jgi:TonB family protein